MKLAEFIYERLKLEGITAFISKESIQQAIEDYVATPDVTVVIVVADSPVSEVWIG